MRLYSVDVANAVLFSTRLTPTTPTADFTDNGDGTVTQKSFTALVLMTDGITDPLFETDNNLRDLSYWDKLWQQIQPQLDDNPELSAENLTAWLDFWSPGNHDDRTIALIYR